MSQEEAALEFKEGLTQLGNEYSSKALAHFANAAKMDVRNPIYLSYLGLAMAAAQQKWQDAEDLCYSAVRMKRTQPELYLNLAEVYHLQGKRQDAVETLLEGFPLTRRDPRIGKALRKYGVRRPPVFSFLDREHILNRSLGKIRYRVMKSAGKEF
jgi:Flp pilus assembly protein TadD